MTYFCNLEKQRQEYNSIDCLWINGEECTDPKCIKKEVFDFYSNLYKSSYSEQNATTFFDKISNLISKINDNDDDDDNFKEVCNDDLTITEFDCSIKNMISNQSPGPDGLTTNFYKHLWENIKFMLFQALIECINQKEPMETLIV